MVEQSNNLFLPNVVGFTGSWSHTHSQYHPRLDMVCFHYCNKSGTRTYDYRPTTTLRSYSNSSHYWEFGKTGQHDSGSQWWIGYTLSSARRQTIFNGEHYLFGMSWDINFRTAAASAVADCRFWNLDLLLPQYWQYNPWKCCYLQFWSPSSYSYTW